MRKKRVINELKLKYINGGKNLNQEIFVIGAWLDNKVKEQNLIEVIKDLKSKNYPVCLVTHCLVSKNIQELVDYFIFEKENILSDDFRLAFWRIHNGVRQEKTSDVNYHGVACLMNIRNAIDLLLAKGQYKYIHYCEADLIYDFERYIDIFQNDMLINNKKALFVHYQDNYYRTDLFSAEISWYNSIIPRAQSWKEYKDVPHSNLILEYWFGDIVKKSVSENDIIFIKDMTVGNKWTQSTSAFWDEDTRQKLDFSDAPVALEQSPEDRYRKESFIKILTLIYNSRIKPNIVEIGMTRSEDSITDGDSTSIWAWYISKYGGSYYGCDNDNKVIEVAVKCLEKYIKQSDQVIDVAVTMKDGLEFIKQYKGQIDLLYLDAIDHNSNSKLSEYFHLQLVIESVNKIKIGGYIMIDDIININTYEGKGALAIPYLLGNNNFSCMHKGYQFIFRRDI